MKIAALILALGFGIAALTAVRKFDDLLGDELTDWDGFHPAANALSQHGSGNGSNLHHGQGDA